MLSQEIKNHPRVRDFRMLFHRPYHPMREPALREKATHWSEQVGCDPEQLIAFVMKNPLAGERRTKQLAKLTIEGLAARVEELYKRVERLERGRRGSEIDSRGDQGGGYPSSQGS